AGQDIALELVEGRQLVEKAATESRDAGSPDGKALQHLGKELGKGASADALLGALMRDETAALMARCAERTNLTYSDRCFPVFVDREKAAFSAWYELMPRSQSGKPYVHGTFDDVIGR